MATTIQMFIGPDQSWGNGGPGSAQASFIQGLGPNPWAIFTSGTSVIPLLKPVSQCHQLRPLPSSQPPPPQSQLPALWPQLCSRPCGLPTSTQQLPISPEGESDMLTYRGCMDLCGPGPGPSLTSSAPQDPLQPTSLLASLQTDWACSPLGSLFPTPGRSSPGDLSMSFRPLSKCP